MLSPNWFYALLPVLVNKGAWAVDASWHAPSSTEINDLDKVLNASGVYGFIFNSSHTPDKDYGQYNWCNMPHVRRREYTKPPKDYELQYVEVIHRHHKRTPYQSNTFPEESYPWNCDDEGLYFYGQPMKGKQSAEPYWKGYQNPVTPFSAPGFKGTCTFPQISKGGLDDSWQHGHDLYTVYHDLLKFLPRKLDLDRVSFRVTTNVITSQVAGMLINGMYGISGHVPLNVESESIDSLEPSYSCPKASDLFSEAKSQPNTTWAEHLSRTKDLFSSLDSVSGVPPSDSGWHQSFDHYFDNLSARLCHAKPLPCSVNDTSKCISQSQADTVFRLGQFEYSYIYRDAPTSLAASTASMGVWIAELAQHLRDQISGHDGKMVYRHNIAHDGSISRVLSIMQIDKMVWPGMGAEIVFELYAKRTGLNKPKKEHFVRVLFGGRVMHSSNPDLGKMDMIPVSQLLEYFDGLVGKRANLVPGLCKK
ncbi:hypothetical protein D8B26_000765 [Coccidioides posadasii str. Silveira]|uniref:Uncharacterized protein n=3 Tax=Coccidioides posadasii TaxID=199306 RepID=E9CSB0_COCPS|nr:Histidine acid phosphatase family protein [Coccidioides posadasii C735 delta SOWgp]EER29021.1 Histidine acid phosphatase family protein [Coccidioides posadasii C735 delta SOWgp]EFW22579.1 conserved hypothetical protein [Coccidioides posadasii str. Silveira]KMM63880.1 hypothetical protein CPAG_00233 [Coccidioides posadasii RMSCC 3488]QVM06051.1 hypothetical protein D8B26_000765 [Coccidioides posadasii str. Silveira]|eukprot:XP_003071166.1 Histidine acid phosphatase family protein [Coccidioides posadasii C735 delta SOWgp]